MSDLGGNEAGVGWGGSPGDPERLGVRSRPRLTACVVPMRALASPKENECPRRNPNEDQTRPGVRADYSIGLSQSVQGASAEVGRRPRSLPSVPTGRCAPCARCARRAVTLAGSGRVPRHDWPISREAGEPRDEPKTTGFLLHAVVRALVICAPCLCTDRRPGRGFRVAGGGGAEDAGIGETGHDGGPGARLLLEVHAGLPRLLAGPVRLHGTPPRALEDQHYGDDELRTVGSSGRRWRFAGAAGGCVGYRGRPR